MQVLKTIPSMKPRLELCLRLNRHEACGIMGMRAPKRTREALRMRVRYRKQHVYVLVSMPSYFQERPPLKPSLFERRETFGRIGRLNNSLFRFHRLACTFGQSKIIWIVTSTEHSMILCNIEDPVCLCTFLYISNQYRTPVSVAERAEVRFTPSGIIDKISEAGSKMAWQLTQQPSLI